MTGITSVLKNVRDRGKRGFIFNTRPTCKQRNRYLKVIKEKLEKNWQECH